MTEPVASRFFRWEARGRVIVPEDDPAPRLMGIVNLTPDSFSDGKIDLRPEEAIDRARRLVLEGAYLLDLGGESSRPGAAPVALEEELLRVIPIVEALASEMTVPLSIDTTKAEVARQALRAGAVIINDITAMEGDPAMKQVIAEAGAGVVLMHMRGTPATMQLNPQYSDVVTEVYDYLAERIQSAVSFGIRPELIAIDPGIGFGKSFGHNLAILRNLRRFESLGCALLVGTSRKGFLGKITGHPVIDRPWASAASALTACVQGARVVRVHDVVATSDTIKVWTALRGWGDSR
jgi:dihydropteroate synthase